MIYLDHAAATPVDSRVFEAMRPYFMEDFFNPSAAYLPSKKVAADYEAAKATIAHAIGAKASDLVMTAGATEANNLAFTSLLDGQISHSGPRPSGPSTEVVDPSSSRKNELARSSLDSLGRPPRADGANSRAAALRIAPSRDICSVLYLVTEHDSVRRVAERYGGEAIEVLPNGLVDLADLKRKITDDTELISIALVNNELGTIQPLSDVAQIIRDVKIDRMKRGIRRQLLLHSDASQALSLIDINVARLGVDLMTLNAAKVYGPKGIGALYVSHEAKLSPLTYGGGQENGLRSGTENVPLAIGFAKAVQLAKEHLNGNRKKYANWRRILLTGLNNYELINKKQSLDSFIVICYDGIDAERLVYLLEEHGVYVATGAACAASKGVKSHVLAAIGLSETRIAGSLRLTMGETNDEEQIREAVRIINETVALEKNRLKHE